MLFTRPYRQSRVLEKTVGRGEGTDFDLARLQLFHFHWLEQSWWVKTNLTAPMARTAGYERDDRSNTELYKLWHYKDEKAGP